MTDKISERYAAGETNIASIDIGSHTARLLICRRTGSSGLFQPLLRKRAYIRLAEGFGDQGEENIGPEAIERTLNALGDFSSIIKEYNAETTHAVSTGVMRDAVNSDRFLDLVYGRTGIKARVISGEEEALLTQKGVLHSLDMHSMSPIIFDLGGGTTEIVSGDENSTEVKSVHIGAAVLTQRYFHSDPPSDERIGALSKYVDEVLEGAYSRIGYAENDFPMVGTGGTVTTLAAMIKRVDIKDITPDRLNGLILKRDQIEDLFAYMKTLPVAERMRLSSMEQGRAGVILAGTMAVIRILYFFRSIQMMVSLSDILEGILIAFLQGEKDE
ncbi:MAG: hypothetical protein JRC68_04920 [Deltaproteobacteria bacterium]|nr:hypothetical protein [Deltaproteobacteria bacterium]